MDESSIASGRRRLSAIMFTDILGFTALMERDETTAVGMIKAGREIVRRNIALFSGEERETIGDAFLVIFESAVQAVECAIKIQQELAAFNRERDAKKQLWMRIGIHLGDIIIEEGSVFGEGVNLAARVEPLAPPGGICITQQVLDQIRHRLTINVHRLGVKELKNVTDAPPLYWIIVDTTAPRPPESLRDKLWRISRSKPIMIGGPLLLAAVMTFVIYQIQFATHVIYAREVAYRYHIPVPIGRLSQAEVNARESAYRLLRRGGKVIQLEWLDKRGLSPESVEKMWGAAKGKASDQDFPREEYSYSNDGRLEEKRTLDRFGVLQFRLTYKEGGSVATVHDASGYVKTFENQIAGFSFSFDKQGRLMQRENRNAFGVLRHDATGVALYRFIYDDQGLLKEESFYDALGNLVDNKDGVAVRMISRNAQGDPVEEQTADRYRVVKESLQGYASVAKSYDVAGNLSEERFRDRFGNPTETKNGICIRRLAHSTTGFLSNEQTLNCQAAPKTNRQGWASLHFSYDDHERLRFRDAFDEAGKPVAASDGVHRTQVDYTTEGRIAQVSFVAPDGNPTINDINVHAIAYRYDQTGRNVSRIFLDKDGKPAPGNSGFAETRLAYSDRGEMTEIAYFDGSGALVNHHDGFAVVRNEYDAFGNLIARSVFDKDNQPILSRPPQPRCHKLTFTYDDKGNLIEQRCFDPSLALTPGIDHCAIKKETFNQYGLLTRLVCYAAENTLVDDSNIPSILTAEYDGRGYLSELKAFDAKGELAERYQGAAIWRRISDAAGNEIEIATYDRNNQLIINPRYRAAIFRREFDSRGNELKLTAFDQEGKPTIGVWGFAEIRYAYDERGNRTSTSYFNERGEPVSDKNGVHEYQRVYDERGRIQQRLYNGVDGKLILNSEGVAMEKLEYDNAGWLAKVSSFGTDSQPVNGHNTKAMSEAYQRDDHGNIIRILHFDETGNPCHNAGCVPIITQELDDKGQLITQHFQDAEGKPTIDEEGVGIYRYAYDSQGRRVMRSLFDTADRPLRDAHGIHRYLLHYSPEHDTIVWYQTYTDPNGKSIVARDGSHLQLFLYDELYGEKQRARVALEKSGRIIHIDCFDDSENVIARSDCATALEVKTAFAKLKPLLP